MRIELLRSTSYVDFQGNAFTASSESRLTWSGNWSKQTRETWFSVKENAPFDIVIGTDFLFSQGIYTFNEASLLFFNRPATRGWSQPRPAVRVFTASFIEEEGQMQRSLERQRDENQQ